MRALIQDNPELMEELETKIKHAIAGTTPEVEAEALA